MSSKPSYRTVRMTPTKTPTVCQLLYDLQQSKPDKKLPYGESSGFVQMLAELGARLYSSLNDPEFVKAILTQTAGVTPKPTPPPKPHLTGKQHDKPEGLPFLG